MSKVIPRLPSAKQSKSKDEVKLIACLFNKNCHLLPAAKSKARTGAPIAGSAGNVGTGAEAKIPMLQAMMKPNKPCLKQVSNSNGELILVEIL